MEKNRLNIVPVKKFLGTFCFLNMFIPYVLWELVFLKIVNPAITIIKYLLYTKLDAKVQVRFHGA